jgi:hypothetical protein
VVPTDRRNSRGIEFALPIRARGWLGPASREVKANSCITDLWAYRTDQASGNELIAEFALASTLTALIYGVFVLSPLGRKRGNGCSSTLAAFFFS